MVPALGDGEDGFHQVAGLVDRPRIEIEPRAGRNLPVAETLVEEQADKMVAATDLKASMVRQITERHGHHTDIDPNVSAGYFGNGVALAQVVPVMTDIRGV